MGYRVGGGGGHELNIRKARVRFVSGLPAQPPEAEIAVGGGGWKASMKACDECGAALQPPYAFCVEGGCKQKADLVRSISAM